MLTTVSLKWKPASPQRLPLAAILNNYSTKETRENETAVMSYVCLSPPGGTNVYCAIKSTTIFLFLRVYAVQCSMAINADKYRII